MNIIMRYSYIMMPPIAYFNIYNIRVSYLLKESTLVAVDGECMCYSGADPGGVLRIPPPPPFRGTPKLLKKGENVARVHAKTLVPNSYPDPPFPKSCIHPWLFDLSGVFILQVHFLLKVARTALRSLDSSSSSIHRGI